MGMTDEATWMEMTSLPCWSPLSGLPAPPTLLAEGLYQWSENAFLLAMPYGADLVRDPARGPFITIVAWAVSPGAARRVYLDEWEGDDGVTVAPPPFVLPPSCEPRYPILLERAKAGRASALESASYRSPDGVFISKSISAVEWRYYFRSPHIESHEMPFVVERRLS